MISLLGYFFCMIAVSTAAAGVIGVINFQQRKEWVTIRIPAL